MEVGIFLLNNFVEPLKGNLNVGFNQVGGEEIQESIYVEWAAIDM